MRERDELPYVVIERQGGGLGPFVIGALLGAGVALLFAPRSGRETRQGITDGVRRMKDGAEDAVRNVQQSVTEAIDGVRSQVVGRVEAAQNAFEAGRDAARESRVDLERRVREARAGFDAGVQAARRNRGQPVDTISDADAVDVDSADDNFAL